MATTQRDGLKEPTADEKYRDRDTCPNGHWFCPRDNDDAREDALMCYTCFAEEYAR